MSRSLTSGMQAAVAAERGTLVHFMELNTSGGTLRLCTYPLDVAWDGQTWDGIGGRLIPGSAMESADLRGQGAPLELSGVDQTVLSTILTYYTRGREAVIYYGHMDEEAGTVIPDPIEVFRGFLNEAWELKEQAPADGDQGTVTLRTRVVSRIAQLAQARPVRTNGHSHREMLRRAGLTGDALNDNFFKHVPELVGKPIYWGTVQPGVVGGKGYRNRGGDDDRKATPR